MKQHFHALIFIAIVLFTTSCATTASSTYVVKTRPAPVVVVRPVSPSPRHIWVDGNWVWHGGRYVWVDGYWAAPRSGYYWKEGYWKYRHGGYVWVAGTWRRR